MPVDPEDVYDISRALVRVYRAGELELLRLIARYLRTGIDAPTWATDRLAAITGLRVSAAEILAGLEQGAATHLPGYVAEAYRDGWGSVLTDLPDSVQVRLAARIAERAIPRTEAVESLAAAVVRDVGQRHSNVLRHVEDVYRRVITEASAFSIAGGVTRRQATQAAWQRFVDQGVTSFTDVRGRTWRLSSYAEMAVRTVTQRAAVQGQTDRQQSLGLDLVIVSDSPNECRLCRPWEGKILALSGPTGRIQVPSLTTGQLVTVDVAGTVTQARSAGLQHPNCTHSLRAYLPGATRQPTRPTANPDDYEAKQRQRAIERQIRAWKEREAAALDDEARAAAAAKVRQWQATMRQHLADHPNLKRQSAREQIGAGNIPRR